MAVPNPKPMRTENAESRSEVPNPWIHDDRGRRDVVDRTRWRWRVTVTRHWRRAGFNDLSPALRKFSRPKPKCDDH